jgi:UPF0716 family protein affecting phage T7 exclusion
MRRLRRSGLGGVLGAIGVSLTFLVAVAISVTGAVLPSRLGAAIRSPEITDRSAGSAPSSRMAGAIELETRR